MSDRESSDQEAWENEENSRGGVSLTGSAPASPNEYDNPASPSPENPTSPGIDAPASPEDDIPNPASPEDDSRPISQNDQQNKNSEAPQERARSESSKEQDEDKPVEENDADSDNEMDIRKRRIIESDDDDDEPSEVSPTKKKVAISSDEDSDGEGESNKKRGNLLISDGSDESENEGGKSRGSEEVGELMANIFGEDSDDDDDDDEPIGDKVPEEENKEEEKTHDDDEQESRRERDPDHQWDFDEMMRQKKSERKRQRRKRRGDGIDIINDDDGRIAAVVEAMKNATKEDRAANQARKPAVKKRKMLPEVKMMLLRSDMFEALIENGMMSAVSDWLSPLPDKSLPALEIRTELLKLLQDFARLDQGVLKQSGLGKAVMMLLKHPKETKENKELAARLIRAWSRPIFQLDTDFRAVTREERESRDQERMPEIKRRRLSDIAPSTSKKEEAALKPGDPGYINRARVPKISTKDYVVRPKHMVEGEFKGERKGRAYDRLNKAQRDFNERTRKAQIKRAVQVSLEGRNLAI